MQLSSAWGPCPGRAGGAFTFSAPSVLARTQGAARAGHSLYPVTLCGHLGSRPCPACVPEPWSGRCHLPRTLCPPPVILSVLPSFPGSLSSLPPPPITVELFWASARPCPFPCHAYCLQANLIFPGPRALPHLPVSSTYVTDFGEFIQGGLLPRARPTCEPRLHSSLPDSVADSDLPASASDSAPCLAQPVT